MRGAMFVCALIGCAHPQSTPPSHELPVVVEKPRHLVIVPMSGKYTGPASLDVRYAGPSQLFVSARAPNLFDAATKKRLSMGLVVEVRWHVEVSAPLDVKPRASSTFTCKIAYDLWNEVFAVVTTSGAKKGVVNMLGVTRLCLEPEKMPLAIHRPLLTGVEHRVVAEVAIDPPLNGPVAPALVIKGNYVPYR